jgi:hypothetical protein
MVKHPADSVHCHNSILLLAFALHFRAGPWEDRRRIDRAKTVERDRGRIRDVHGDGMCHGGSGCFD